MANTPKSKPLVLKGTKKNDTLTGGALGDTINGDKGNDTLIGNGGADNLRGGAGADTFEYVNFRDSSGTQVDLIKDFDVAEGDKVDLTALGAATLRPSYIPNSAGLQAVFTFDPAANKTTLSYYNGSDDPVFRLNFTGNISYSPGAFVGIVTPSPTTYSLQGATVYEDSGAITFTVTRSGDTSVASSVNYIILPESASGEDYVLPAGYPNPIHFAAGQTTTSLTLAVTKDIAVEGIEHFQVLLYGENGTYDGVIGTIIDNDQATPRNDNLTGTHGNDYISLLGGYDIYNGLGGDDIIYGGTGADTLTGGAGADLFYYFNRFDSIWSIYGDARDTITDFSSSEGDKIRLFDSNSTVDGVQGWMLTTDFRVDFGKGQLVVTENTNGTYTLTAYMVGRDIEEPNFSIVLNSPLTASDFYGDVIDSPPVNVIHGTDGSDSIVGTDSDDLIRAFFGDDMIDPGLGSDIILGGSGSDRLVARMGGTDYFNGGGIDYFSSNSVDFTQATGAIRVIGHYVDGKEPTSGAEYNWISFSQEGVGTLSVTHATFFEFTDFADIIDVSSWDSHTVLHGNGGNDQLRGSRGGNLIHGGDGEDLVWGNDGTDILAGGEGADVFYGGAGNDEIYGSHYGDAGWSEDGDRSNDVLFGEDGNDYVAGGAGDDSLDGGTGNDYLFSGSGVDQLIGGSGADIFGFHRLSDSSVASPDIIFDFNPGDGDQIDLRQLDIDPSTGQRSSDWVFVSGGYSPTVGQTHTQITMTSFEDGSGSTLSVYLPGDAIADFQIKLVGYQGSDAGIIF